MKFIQKLNRKFQLFLAKSQDRKSLKEVVPTTYDLLSFITNIEDSTFAGSLPPVLLQKQSHADAPSEKEKRKNSKSCAVTNNSKKPK